MDQDRMKKAFQQGLEEGLDPYREELPFEAVFRRVPLNFSVPQQVLGEDPYAADNEIIDAEFVE